MSKFIKTLIIFLVAFIIVAFIILFMAILINLETDHYYVTADRLNVRLSPSLSGRITNVLEYGSRVKVFELRDEWARISDYYSAFLEEPLDSEEKISKMKDGTNTARWVSFKYLSKSKPAPRTVPSNLPATPLLEAIKSSDDFYKYGAEFFVASKELVSRGKCSVKDFEEQGGWWRSTRKKAVYYVICGEAHNDNKVYLDVISGQFIPAPPIP